MKDEIDMDPVGKALPLKNVKLPNRAVEVQHDIPGVSNLDPSYTYKYVDYLKNSPGVQAEMAKEVREHEILDSTANIEKFQQAKESFMTMMEIRNVLIDAYEQVRKMRA